MSKFTKEKQTDIVKQALELETNIQNRKRNLSQLKQEKFKSIPDEPVRKVINQKIQPVAPDYSKLPQLNYTFTAFLEDDIKNNPNFFNKLFSAHPFKRSGIICGICFVLSIVLMSIVNYTMNFIAVILSTIATFAIPAAVIYWLIKQSAYTNKKKELTVQLAQTPAYVQAKAEADRIAQQKQDMIAEDLRVQQANLDSQYAKEKEHYDTVVLPQYKTEFSVWTKEHNKMIRTVSDKLESDYKAQSELYETSKIIPMQYRSIKALTYIYQLMSTSDYDIKEAIDMYDKEIQRQQEAARIEELRRANELVEEQNYRLHQQNQIAAEQNDLLAEQNDLEIEAQRNQRQADFVSAVQRHNTNKYLKNRK